ncbi:MAG TPA: transcriptional repressor [Dehalococcoidia bacterium]|nr:transcriptional repressor [Dehalococcoidia bacterium]
MTAPAVQRRALRVLRQRGYKMTPQRRAVVRALSQTTSHLTPAQLHAAVREIAPDVGLVTIYRTLRLLVELGLACEISADARQPTYLLSRPAEHHHHLICSKCGHVVDFTSEAIERLGRRLAAETGYTIQNHVLEFVGTCPLCRDGRRPR